MSSVSVLKPNAELMDISYDSVITLIESFTDGPSKKYVYEALNIILNLELALSITTEPKKGKFGRNLIRTWFRKKRRCLTPKIEKWLYDGCDTPDIYSWLARFKQDLNIVLSNAVVRTPEDLPENAQVVTTAFQSKYPDDTKSYIMINPTKEQVAVTFKYACRKGWQCIGKFNSMKAMEEKLSEFTNYDYKVVSEFTFMNKG